MRAEPAQKIKTTNEPFFFLEKDVISAAEYFSLFAEPVRLRILAALCQISNEITVNEIVDRTGISQPNVSRHLKRLLLAGIVSRRRSKTNAFYSLQDPFVLQACNIICSKLQDSNS